jgi:hypothetical protein
MDETPNTQHHLEMEPLKNTGDKVKDDIIKWIEKVSEVRPELGGFSICPFAKKANYKIIEMDINDIYPIYGYDVIIYIINHNDLKIINHWVDFYNKKYQDWLFFEDCASYDTFINGIQTNNGKHNLILGQPKEKLKKFREILKKTDYYSYWDKDYYKEIMGSDCES